MKIITIIVVILLIGAFLIISNEHIKINSISGIVQFSKLYWNWLGNLYSNGKALTGKAVEFFKV